MLPSELRVEERSFGLSIRGEAFHVWDSDPETALSWALELERVAPQSPARGSTSASRKHR
jgi:hypothetical protein